MRTIFRAPAQSGATRETAAPSVETPEAFAVSVRRALRHTLSALFPLFAVCARLLPLCAVASAAGCLLPSCAFDGGKNREAEICVVSYNAQTFFDSVTTGAEFTEFRKEPWNEELYRERLKRLAEAVETSRTAGAPASSGKTCGAGGAWRTAFQGFTGKSALPDVVVLQEIENAEVAADLCAFLPVQDFYRDIVFVPPGNGASFSTAVLSAIPVKRLTIHGTALPPADRTVSSQTVSSLRPLLEIIIESDGGAFALFAVHWKSKGGTKAPDGNKSVRSRQERVLIQRIEKLEQENPGMPFIVCGDFNQQPEEFSRMGAFPCAWDYLPVSSGTYFFRGEWEKIDNFFVSAHFTPGLASGENRFHISNTPPLVNAAGEPRAFRLYTRSGYSDHLPLVFRFTMRALHETPYGRKEFRRVFE